MTRTAFERASHHTSDSYMGWLRTDSLVNTLDHGARRGFLGDIGRLIETSFDGAVDRNFIFEIITARRS